MRGESGEPMDPLASLEIDRCSELLGSSSSDEMQRGLDRFLGHIHPSKAHRQRDWRRRWRRWSLVGAGAVASTLLLLQASSFVRRHDASRAPEAPMLAYRVEGGSELESGYLRESGHAGVQVHFSEGSRFDLTPGARGRIRSVDRQGAHLTVEHGKASFQIVPGGRRWLVDVGPFLVTVKGTVFTAAWDPSGEQFELNLQRGQVVVQGPVSAGEISLRAGQRLVVSLPRSESVITDVRQEPEGPVGDRSDSVRPGQGGPATRSQTTRQHGISATPSKADKTTIDHRWREQLARGRWDRVLDEVKRIGVNETLANASSEDLFALANAARYHHEFDLARAALQAERRRFPESPRALGALYLLGRVDELRDTGTAQAIAWYDQYLAQAPGGPLVGEALGRKMILIEKLEGPARARVIAEDYLRRFPKGNYAGEARELATAP